MCNSLLTQALATSFEELLDSETYDQTDQDDYTRILSLVDSASSQEIDNQMVTLEHLLLSVESLISIQLNLSDIGYSSENLKPVTDVFFSYNPVKLKEIVSLESEEGVLSTIKKFLSSIWAIIRTICKGISNWWNTMGESKKARDKTIAILKEQIPRVRGTPIESEVSIGPFKIFQDGGNALTVESFKTIGDWYKKADVFKLPPVSEVESQMAEIIKGPSAISKLKSTIFMTYRKLVNEALTSKYATAVFGDKFKPVFKTNEEYLKEAAERHKKEAEARENAPKEMKIFTKAELEVVLETMIQINKYLDDLAKTDESAKIAALIDKKINTVSPDQAPLTDETKDALKSYAEYLKSRMDLYVNGGKSANRTFKMMYQFCRYHINHYPHITLVATKENSGN